MKSTVDDRVRAIDGALDRSLTSRELRRQSGITLIELIIGLAIIALVSAVIVTAIYQLLSTSKQSNDQQYAVSQLRQAEHWMSRDALMSQTVVVDPGPSGFPLSLFWTTSAGDNHSVVYALQSMLSGSLYSLRREETITAPDNTSTTSVLLVADSIDSAQSLCYESATRTLTVTLVAAVRGHIEVRSFEATRRSEA